MKRFWTVFVVAIMTVLLISSTVFADDNIYRIDEAGIQIMIPEYFHVIMRDTPADDAFYASSGISKSEQMQEWEADGIYLDAYSVNDKEEIIIGVTDDQLENFRSINDVALQSFLSLVVNEFAQNGFAAESDIYQHPQAKFGVLRFSDAETNLYATQYITSINKKTIAITFRSYNGEFSNKQVETIETIVNSIAFENTTSSAFIIEESTDSFVYSDEKSSVSFTVPANWKQESSAPIPLSAKFVYNNDPGGIIFYGSTDFFENMPSVKNNGYSRMDLNIDKLSEEDFQSFVEAFGLEEKNTVHSSSILSYNNITYYKIDALLTSDVYGFNATSPIQVLFTMRNGWGYFFLFYGDTTMSSYADFEKLVSSVQYPVIPQTITPETTNTALLIITLIVVGVAVAVFVARSRKKSATADQFQGENASTRTICCGTCGATLPEDSVFCHKCGARIH